MSLLVSRNQPAQSRIEADELDEAADGEPLPVHAATISTHADASARVAAHSQKVAGV
jgi:hypothetical protein